MSEESVVSSTMNLIAEEASEYVSSYKNVPPGAAADKRLIEGLGR